MSTPTTAPLDALIIGAGFGGIGMGIALRRADVEAFQILEQAQDLGGVWRDNTYPGAACDIPSHLYSFSFEPYAGWTRVFATQPEIHAYLQHCARKYGVLPHIRFGAGVTAARYDDALQLWAATLADGTTLSARMLITATGQLSRPALPEIQGSETFRGHSFHSAAWDHTHDLAGQRVAVIGTGASAAQFVPPLAAKAAHLTVFQRTPAWMIPRPDRAYSRFERAVFRHVPGAARLYRAAIYVQYESRALGFTRVKSAMKLAVGLPFKRMLARQVPDPALRARLTPDYPIGCKRILLSSDYLAALARPNVTLVTETIRRITPDGIETTDGQHHAADTIVYGTGFAATKFLAPMRVTGRGGVDLNTAWQDGAHAYLGISVPGFPNFFMLYGPNTNLGHNSIIYMLESQIAHVLRCWRALKEKQARSIEVRPGPSAQFQASVQTGLGHSVWQGCRSWYLDDGGRNTVNWPGFTFTYRHLARRASLDAYALSS
ncbi:NAD(P)/FAD-dependent oxidoreductase [Massilia arenosa]|uniref:NAD(P)/FAD-dependent oxidoreductase n=1 Tax=Zemynaea arenosa TaxID=2561931 RepID=A0A4Y9SL53_9BURK|nr:NAD(P)/FAD-dependent oxidoreductase [Massilia arenosa]